MIGQAQLLILCVEETVREEAVWVLVCPLSGSRVPLAVHETRVCPSLVLSVDLSCSLVWLVPVVAPFSGSPLQYMRHTCPSLVPPLLPCGPLLQFACPASVSSLQVSVVS